MNNNDERLDAVRETVIEMRPIGCVRSPFSSCGEAPIQSARAMDKWAELVILPEYEDGLADLDGFDCIWVLWAPDLAKKPAMKVVPFADDTERGLFATRAPARPNPICMSVARLEKIEGSVLFIRGVDMVDGTPVLDIKPYIPGIDARAECEKTGWLTGKSMEQRADGRFEKSEE